MGTRYEEDEARAKRQMTEFETAPADVQAKFWAAIEKRTAEEHQAAQRWEDEAEELGFSTVRSFYEAVIGPWERRFCPWAVRVWDRLWSRRRASALRREKLRRQEVIEVRLDSEIAVLHDVEATEYVEALTGEWVPDRARKIICPLPNHEEHTPSFHVYRWRWRCFGCGEGGDIYDLAGALWGLDTSGPDFRAIHERLWEMFR